MIIPAAAPPPLAISAPSPDIGPPPDKKVKSSNIDKLAGLVIHSLVSFNYDSMG